MSQSWQIWLIYFLNMIIEHVFLNSCVVTTLTNVFFVTIKLNPTICNEHIHKQQGMDAHLDICSFNFMIVTFHAIGKSLKFYDLYKEIYCTCGWGCRGYPARGKIWLRHGFICQLERVKRLALDLYVFNWRGRLSTSSRAVARGWSWVFGSWSRDGVT